MKNKLIKFKNIFVISIGCLAFLLLYTNAGTAPAAPEVFQNLMPNTQRAYDVYIEDVFNIQDTLYFQNTNSFTGIRKDLDELYNDPIVIQHRSDFVLAMYNDLINLGFQAELSTALSPHDGHYFNNRVKLLGGPSSPVSDFFVVGDYINRMSQLLKTPFVLDPKLMINDTSAAEANGNNIRINPKTFLDTPTANQSAFLSTLQHEINHAGKFETAKSGQACVTCAYVLTQLQVPSTTPQNYLRSYGAGFSVDEVNAGRLNVEQLSNQINQLKQRNLPVPQDLIDSLNNRVKGLNFLTQNTLAFAYNVIQNSSTLILANVVAPKAGYPGIVVKTANGEIQLPHISSSASIQTIRNEVKLAGERLHGVARSSMETIQNTATEHLPTQNIQEINNAINEFYTKNPAVEASTRPGFSSLSDQYRALAHTANRLAVANPSAVPSILLRVPVPSQTNPIGTLNSVLGFDPDSITHQKRSEAKGAIAKTTSLKSPEDFSRSSELFARGASLTELSNTTKYKPSADDITRYSNDVTAHKNAGGQGVLSSQQMADSLIAKGTQINSVINSSSGVPGVLPSRDLPQRGAGFNDPMSLAELGIPAVQSNGTFLPVNQVNTYVTQFNNAIENFRPQDSHATVIPVTDYYLGFFYVGSPDNINTPGFEPSDHLQQYQHIFISPEGKFYQIERDPSLTHVFGDVLTNIYSFEGPPLSFGNLSGITTQDNDFFSYQQGVQIGNATFSISGNDGGFIINIGFGFGGP